MNAPPPATTSSVTVFHDCTLIDGTGAAPVSPAVVVVADGRIRSAGPAPDGFDPAATYPGAELVALGGHTMCPGFFDCHVHLGLPGTGGPPLDTALRPSSYLHFQLIERLRVTLHAGVTSARDLMGVDAGVRAAIADGLIAGPRLQVAIDMLSQTCGHADFALPSGLDPTPLLGGSIVDTVDAARTRVRHLVRAGADVIKVATSGGISSPNDDPDWLGLRREAVAAVVEEARNLGGRPVAAHAIGRAGIEAAVAAGVHSIEHGYALDDELRHRMVEGHVFLVPTLLETVRPVTASPQGARKSAIWHRLAQESVRASVAAGVPIAVGTDAGLGPAHGTNLRELALLVEYGGMTPMQAIVAGTRTSAQLCGVEDDLGTLEEGKWADLIVVRGDPLRDVSLLGDPENVLLVVKGGETAVDRAGLRR